MTLHIFFDTSALLKRYAPEQGSQIINVLFQYVPIEHMTCSTLSIIELYSVLVRKRNDGRITPLAYRQTFAEFVAEIADNEAFATASVDDRLILSAVDFVDIHHINATDAIILRSALDLQQALRDAGDTLLFCAADRRLLRAAAGDGLPVLNPEEATEADVQQLLGGATT